MTSAGSGLSSSAFATADAGFEYLATAEHYQYLAKGIVDALYRGCLVLVTGDPPASPTMLAAALREAAAPRAVIELSCSPDLDCMRPFAGGSTGPDGPAPVATGEEPGSSVPPSPIFLFADAQRLSDDQIDEFCEVGRAIPLSPNGFEAGVLLAPSDFVTHAEGARLRLLDEGLAAHLRVQQLERDEVAAFIRHQLPLGVGADLLTAQRMALIALTSGGDPAVVNRIARRMLQLEPDVATPPPVRPRRRAVSLRLPAGIIICLGAAWLVAGGAFERRDLGALVALVRDHIVPRNEPTGVGAAPLPEASTGSPTVNVATGPPHAAAADQPTPEPMAGGVHRLGGTSPPGSISEPALHSTADATPLSASEITVLLARGDAFLAAGDIASARLFFERAADAGDSRAAMRMAVTYDAAFLERAGLHGLRSNPGRAAFWYRRARELGEARAEPPLGSLGSPGSAEPLPQLR
jgi:hypothetical protein